MKPFVLTLPILVLGVCGCAGIINEGINSSEEPSLSLFTFTASWGDKTQSRTTLQQDGKTVVWSPEDQIIVYSEDGTGHLFKTGITSPSQTAAFTGLLPSDPESGTYWAAYPYESAKSCDGASVTLSIPSTQTAVKGSFQDKVFPSIALTESDNLQFKHVGSLFVFSVTQEGVRSAILKGNNEESLAGTFKAGFDANGNPTVSDISSGETAITLASPDDNGFKVGEYYYITLIPQTLQNGYTLTLTKESVSLEVIRNGESTFARADFRRIKNVDQNKEYDKPAEGNIIFADAIVKNTMVANYDKNGDGELSYYEASLVQEIGTVLAYKSITSFDEFRFFTSVKAIAAQAFEDCSQLKSIILPDSIKTIGDGAFIGCSSLTSISIPNSVIGIGQEAFGLCEKLQTVKLPNFLQTLRPGAFFDCKKLSSITIPETVTSLPADLFSGCKSLSSLSIPNSVTSIGQSAFQDCTKLTEITIPSSVTTLGSGVFSGCKALRSVILPSGLQTIPNSLFNDCSSLGSINIPPSVISLESLAFNGCSSLPSITLPDGIISIGAKVFSGCSMISEIIIPESVRNIDHNIYVGQLFDGCDNLSSIKGKYSSDDHRCLIVDGDLVGFAPKGLTSYSLPEGITSIEAGAFSTCTELKHLDIPRSMTDISKYAFESSHITSISIPESVTSIKDMAFSMSAIASITLPDGLKSIDDSAFEYCENLEAVIFGTSLESIGNSAFEGCSKLNSIILPSSINTIGSDAFYDCSGMISITLRAINPPALGDKAFHNANGCKLLVPAESVQSYKDSWSSYASRIEALSE